MIAREQHRSGDFTKVVERRRQRHKCGPTVTNDDRLPDAEHLGRLEDQSPDLPASTPCFVALFCSQSRADQMKYTVLLCCFADQPADFIALQHRTVAMEQYQRPAVAFSKS